MVVGRGVVMKACDAALTGAVGGSGRLVVLAGEAGIGKTAVARAVADAADAAGAVVRWGACWDGWSLPAFGVWLDLFGRPGGDACAAVAGRLEGGVLDAGPDAPAAERARARFFREVMDALRSVASDRPQVLVLEDLHWADTGSLELLRALAPQLPAMAVLAVATYRTDESAVPSALAGLGGAAEHLGLEGLDDDAVAELLSEILGREPTEAESRSVQQRTGGNPLFVTQVGRLLATGSSAGVPAGVREVLGRRLARVSSGCHRVLGAAAVLGAEFDVSATAALLGDEEFSVLGDLEEAAARLVAPPAAGRRWSFVHDLLRAVRYETLGSAERAELHRRAVECLARTGMSAAVLAHHAFRAGFAVDDPTPARVAVEAAREALDRFSWDDAVELCRRALDEAPTGESGHEIRAEAWLALGDAWLRIGDAPEAAEAFTSAAEIGRQLGKPDLLARAALGFGAGLGGFEVRLMDHRQVDLLEEAATIIDEASPLRPLVLARLSVALSFVGSRERRLDLANEAVRLGRRLHDPTALTAGLAARCDANAGPAHAAERLAASAEIVAVAQRQGDASLELLGRRLRVVALLELRDLLACDAEVAAYARTADRLGDPLYSWWVPLWRAARIHANGNLDEAERLSSLAAEVGRSGGSSNAELLHLVSSGIRALDRVDAAALETIWESLTSCYPELFAQEVATAAMAGYLAARMGRTEAARSQLARAGGVTAFDEIFDDQEWLAAVAELLVTGVAAGDDDVAARAYELLLPHAGLGVFDGAGAADHGVVDRYLALSAGHLGDHAAAAVHLSNALDRNAGAGRLVLAHTKADGARALAGGSSDDRRRARRLAGEAIEDFVAMGLDGLADQLRPLLDTLASSAPAVQEQGRHANLSALVCEGDTWAVTYAGETVRVKHVKGIADLAVLLARPGRHVHVRELEGVDHLDLPASRQASLDATAIEQYRRRLADLEEDLQQAEDDQDVGRAERSRTERDALVDHLTSSLGLGGRVRSSGSDPDERLRKAVSARVKAAIERLEGLHPALGRHLRNAVGTGYWCVYDPEQPTSWTVDTDRHR
jgi:tetratricopeptide (TPR) repeat protein